MFEEVFSAVNSFFSNLDFFGIPFLFWVIAVIVLFVAIILAFVIFRPKKLYSDSTQNIFQQNNYSLSSNQQSSSAPSPKVTSTQAVTQEVSKNSGVSNASQQVDLSSNQNLPSQGQPSLQQPLSVAQSESTLSNQAQTSQKDINIAKTDSSLKQLLITKFQSKIEGQLGDKIVINDVSSQNENFLVTINISGVGMILTLDPAGKIIDYKKILPSQK